MDEKEAEARPLMGTIFLVVIVLARIVCPWQKEEYTTPTP